MTEIERRNVVQAAALGGAALLVASATTAQAQPKPPVVAAPAGARQVTITLRLTSKDAAQFKAHLLNVIPVTRVASGCRYSHSYQDAQKPAEFVLIQGWDSLAQQQGYLAWRDSTGDLKQLIGMLAKPPVVEVFELFDA